ncbi:helix-turn-helix domain-containing protein [Micromonospora echinofusca]|uniref:Helix-turn-helix domain-containing protein n=1 Tax=Micromonospora echinofusca TaxID=47858 RepID=A0ABS3VQV5_MICEH|nr:Scr1 family TA system antitoxin-like transcriptional regulator [Micromonospora echinofusca]MBO4206907.1 helix-turn-helix domain-containing protein [Micromonospora echinofusca]
MPDAATLELFADELRRARADAGFSQESLAQRISYSPSLIAKIELAQRRPTREFARHCDDVLATGGRLSRIQRVVGRPQVLPWFRQWVEIEQSATALRVYQLSVIPGLLQTEGYARALLLAGALRRTGEVEQQVTARLARQEILHRDDPPHLVAVIDERVLYQPVGGPAVMREQLDHVVRVCAERPRVRIQVVPTAVGAHVGLSGPFVIATLPDEDDAAFLDDLLYGQLVDQPRDLATLRQVWEALRSEALSHQQSIELIREGARRWS